MHNSVKQCRSKAFKFVKNWTLPLAIATGIAGYFIYVGIPFFDSTHAVVARIVAFVQPLLIFSMLFLTFLNIGPRDLRLRRWHLWHTLIQLGVFAAIACTLIFVTNESHRIMLESLMLCLLCPTATAAAVVTRKLDGNPADITAYTILINIAIAITAPILLPLAHPSADISFIKAFALIMMKVFPLLIFPLLAAWAMRKWTPAIATRLAQWRDLPFYLWAVALSLAVGVTVKAIVHSNVALPVLICVGVISLLSCIVQFAVGKRIGLHYNQVIEAGQALGQKNTVFIIWMGYTFLSPVSSVAGGLYSIWHNLYNSYQLYRHRKTA